MDAHIFSTELAKRLDVNQAIFIHNLAYWIEFNQNNNKNFHEGYYWTFNSVKAHKLHFKYWSIQQITRIITKLEVDEIIRSEVLNKKGYDRTKWYTIIDQDICRYYKLHFPKSINGVVEIGKPIPDNKQYNKPKEEIYKEDYSWFLKHLIECTGIKYRSVDLVKLKARLKTFTKEEIKQAILKASKSEYHIGEGFRYLKPDFFTRNDQKIDQWLNAPESKKEKTEDKKLSIQEELKLRKR